MAYSIKQLLDSKTKEVAIRWSLKTCLPYVHLNDLTDNTEFGNIRAAAVPAVGNKNSLDSER